ncbi:MAG: proline--tRNA ligase [Candidatus Micrarchaeota archaeon]|nr:proline--tRNA ligase [Candidatus Micrarchaeota archaeon]
MYDELLEKGDVVDIRYPAKGFIVVKPWGMRIIKHLYREFEDLLEEDGHHPVHFPAVIPEDNLRKEGEHFKGFESEVFWITRAGLKELQKKLILRPTSETAIYPMFALWIKGHSDLPVKVYLSEAVWRYETKATRPLIRGREFLWIETHDAFRTHEDAHAQVLKDLEIATKVIKELLKLDFIMVRRPDWDRFAGAEYTYAIDVLLPDGKVLQIATTHNLGQKFAKVFDIKFMDKDEQEKYVHQTCFGIGIYRILASIIYIHGDEVGLRLPSAVAPVQVAVIPVKPEAEEYAKEISKDIPYRTEVDLSQKSPGNKFFYWDKKGVPAKVVVGPKEMQEGTVTISMRTGEKITVPREKMVQVLSEKIKEYDEGLFKPIAIKDVSSLDELEQAIKEKKVARAGFCSISEEGKQCYQVIKEKFNAEVRGERIDIQESPEGMKCLVCGKEAKHVVYIAKQY